MSKLRAQLRAEREAEIGRRRAAERVVAQRRAQRRQRRAALALRWRRGRLWRHTSGFQRRKDAWAGLLTLVLAVVVLTYLFTSSVGAVLLVGLVAIIGIPAFAVLFLDRRP